MDKSEQLLVELRLPSVLGFEKVPVAAATTVAEGMGFSKDRIDDMRTALSEACRNAIEHGNRQQAGVQVLVTLTGQASGLQVEVADQGEGPGERGPGVPRIEDKLAGEDTSRGWGLFLIDQLVDQVTYEKSPEGGNITRLLIKLDPQE